MRVYKEKSFSNNITSAGECGMEKNETEEYETLSFNRQFRLGEFSEQTENNS